MPQFDTLSLSQKYTLLSAEGKYLKTIRNEGRKVNLYEMNERYYEVRFDTAGHTIDRINVINDTNTFKGVPRKKKNNPLNGKGNYKELLVTLMMESEMELVQILKLSI